MPRSRAEITIQEQATMQSDDFKNRLRAKAKARQASALKQKATMNDSEYRNLVEELQIHQIELEIQNEELRNAQKVMEENRDRYFSLFENAPVGYVILDHAGMVKQFNTPFADLFQIQVVKRTGMVFADLLSPKDAAVFRSRFAALFKNPAGKMMEATVRTADGNQRHVQVTAAAHMGKQDRGGADDPELLLMVTDITDLKRAKQSLEKSLHESRNREREISGFLKGARAVIEQENFETTARKVFDICSELIGATSGYVALLSDDGSENEVLFLEAGDLPCDVDPELPMPIRGLREVAYQEHRAVYDNDFMDSHWQQYMPEGHVRLENVLFAPLVIDDKAVGLIGMANKNGDFSDNDAGIAQGFAELAAIALQNSWHFEKRTMAEKANQKLIDELQKSLANVKQLSGLLPICAHCKKIRDDQGYWEQLESYLDRHSDVKFSHGICQDCLKKHYPEFCGDDQTDDGKAIS
jgi:PAS domain S-box-containing protein